MVQVEVFESRDPDRLAELVNTWLAKDSDSRRVVSIYFSVAGCSVHDRDDGDDYPKDCFLVSAWRFAALIQFEPVVNADPS